MLHAAKQADSLQRVAGTFRNPDRSESRTTGIGPAGVKITGAVLVMDRPSISFTLTLLVILYLPRFINLSLNTHCVPRHPTVMMSDSGRRHFQDEGRLHRLSNERASQRRPFRFGRQPTSQRG